MSAETSASSRVPALDGVRGVAILAVLIGHATGSARYAWAGRHIPNPGYAISELGVRLFFVLSGFVITTALVRQQRERPATALRRFWMRRLFRILPAYLAFLIALLGARAAGALDVDASDLWRAATFTMNYAPRPAWTVLHLWSLAVEMQFYVLWPLLLVYFGARHARAWATAVLLLVPLVRIVEGAAYPDGGSALLAHRFETTADALAAGCLMVFAGELVVRATRRYFRVSFWTVPLAIGVLSGILLASGSQTVVWLCGVPLMNAAMALGIHQAAQSSGGWFDTTLSAHPMVILGTMSYSVYLWQQVFLAPRSALVIQQWPCNWLALALAASLSFYLVERPGLRLRSRVESWIARRMARFTLQQGQSAELPRPSLARENGT